MLILIILGSEVSVQMEQEDLENQISPSSTSNKDVPFVLDSEPGKEWIQLKEVGKNENLGKQNKNDFWNFHLHKTTYRYKYNIFLKKKVKQEKKTFNCIHLCTLYRYFYCKN